MVLTTVLLEVSTVALPVEIGSSSPTCSVATWLSITTTDGFDRTLMSVTAWSASRIILGDASGPMRKLKPGNARLMNALATPAAADVAAADVAAADGALGAVVLSTE